MVETVQADVHSPEAAGLVNVLPAGTTDCRRSRRAATATFDESIDVDCSRLDAGEGFGGRNLR